MTSIQDCIIPRRRAKSPPGMVRVSALQRKSPAPWRTCSVSSAHSFELFRTPELAGSPTYYVLGYSTEQCFSTTFELGNIFERKLRNERQRRLIYRDTYRKLIIAIKNLGLLYFLIFTYQLHATRLYNLLINSPCGEALNSQLQKYSFNAKKYIQRERKGYESLL